MRPRVLLLTSPCNPLGVLYSPATLQACLLWALERWGLLCVVVARQFEAGRVRGLKT